MKNPFRRTVDRVLYVGALAALLPLAFATPAQAVADQVDQSLVEGSWLGFQSNVAFMAQTFTAGLTGQVDRVSLPVNTPTGFARFTVSLRGVASNGMPNTTVLGTSATASGAFNCCTLRNFTFSPYVAVTSGSHYAIVVQVSSGTLRWQDAGVADAYAGGRQYVGGSPSSWFTTSHGDFGFQEWVVTNVNLAPVVSASRTAVSVLEGTVPTNSGTCVDPDGDTVTVTASSGTVSACTGGAWTWTQSNSDESPTQTVTVTADDGHGLSNSTSFTVNVAPVDPTATILSDPLSVPEGTSVPFTGGATSPDPADNAAGFTYTWTVTTGTSVYATGTGSSFSFVPADDGTFLVTFTATDDGGMSGTTSMTLVATNVAPTAVISSVSGPASLVTTVGETLSFGGSFTDADTGDSYTTTWSFGDGTSASGTSASHSYSAPGTYTVAFQVSDGEGGTGRATTTVTIQTTQQALSSIAAYVNGLSGLNKGEKNSLIAKLNAASDAAARGNQIAASNELNAFLNELQGYVNAGKVSAAAASSLRTSVRAVQAGLGTFSRLLQWRPLEP